MVQSSSLFFSSTMHVSLGYLFRILGNTTLHPIVPLPHLAPAGNVAGISSSSSSESESGSVVCVLVCRGTGGPHAMLSIRLLTRSSRRRWVSSSYCMFTSRTEPSSQPSARIVEAGLGEMDQMGPPCELIVRCFIVSTSHSETSRSMANLDIALFDIPLHQLATTPCAEEPQIGP